MEGILLVDKPIDWTSFDVVNRVRGVIARDLSKKPRSIKVGHTGTLDPAATGLLVICIGKSYTKKVPEMIIHDKTYEAEIYFGAHSTTGDAEGDITKDEGARKFDKTEIEEVLKSFLGVSQQTPPQHSAVKVGGKRAYELARKGQISEIKPRDITIYTLDLAEYSWPRAKVKCRVGSGTYIRVLAEDIGKKLSVGAYLSALRRTSIDEWLVEKAVSPIDINIDIIKEKLLV